VINKLVAELKKMMKASAEWFQFHFELFVGNFHPNLMVMDPTKMKLKVYLNLMTEGGVFV
jgi:hypothetical protein